MTKEAFPTLAVVIGPVQIANSPKDPPDTAFTEPISLLYVKTAP
jgi:hypothetical protein